MCGHGLDSCLWYSVSWHTHIQDFRIVPAARHYSISVLLPERETSCNYLQRYQVKHENRPHRRPSRIKVVTFPVQLLHIWYATADPPVKRVCYADDITDWATGPKIPQLESMINSYLREVNIYLKDNSLLMHVPKSTVTLFTRTNTSSRCIPILLLKTHSYHCSAVLKYWEYYGSIIIHKHCNYVSDRIDKRSNMLKALAASSWAHDNETLLLTNNALGKSIEAMQHQSGAPTQVTRALRRYRQRRMRLWGGRPGPTRWPVLTTSTRSPSGWGSRTTQIWFLRSTL